MNRRKVTLLLIAAIALVAGGVWSQGLERHAEPNNQQIVSMQQEELYPASLVALEKHYSTIEEITQDAAYIIEGELVSQSRELIPDNGFSSLDFVYSTFKVNQVIKGSLNGQKEIIVKEVGDNAGVVGGIPHFTNAQPYVLFLIEEDGYYYICGAYQGRFIVKNGYAFQQATVDAHLNNYLPLTSQSFAQTIQNQVVSPRP